jgi:hypothetical protein
MSERVSLEQLFEESPDLPSERPRRTQPWLHDPVLALAISGAIFAVLRVFGFVLPFGVLIAVVLAVLLLRRLLAAVPVNEPPAALYSPAWGIPDDDDRRFAPIDGVVRAVQRWEARFSWTERDQLRYATAVRPRLVELVEERLRQRHGVTVQGDPARAKAILGDPLWTFLHAPAGRGPNPREMAAIVVEMEKI